MFPSPYSLQSTRPVSGNQGEASVGAWVLSCRIALHPASTYGSLLVEHNPTMRRPTHPPTLQVLQGLILEDSSNYLQKVAEAADHLLQCRRDPLSKNALMPMKFSSVHKRVSKGGSMASAQLQIGCLSWCGTSYNVPCLHLHHHSNPHFLPTTNTPNT